MRAFEDDDVIHAEDTVDPVRDINTICAELRLKDISYMKGKAGGDFSFELRRVTDSRERGA